MKYKSRQGVFFGLLLLLMSNAMAQEKWAVMVGVNDYQSKSITSLQYAVADVQAVAEALKKQGVPQKNLFLLTDNGKARDLATGSNIIWRLEWLAKKVQPEDTVIFYFSGHGMERNGETYLLSHDADIGSPTTLRRTAVRMAEVKEILDRFPAKALITFMDACRNDPVAGKSVSSPNSLTSNMSRDLSLVVKPKDIGKKTTVTYFSCSPGERSWESSSDQRGFFSHYVIKGLGGEAADASGKITINSLETYLSRSVSPAVDRSIGKQQTPWAQRSGSGGGGIVLGMAGSNQITTSTASLGSSVPNRRLPVRNTIADVVPEIKITDDPLATESLDELTRLAETGDAEASHALGRYWSMGMGGRIDERKGLDYLRAAVEGGRTEAISDLAHSEFYVNNDPTATEALLRDGEAKRDARSLASLASWHLLGGLPGVPKDESKALQYYEKAARIDGNSASMVALAYEVGLWGVSENKKAAERWNKIARKRHEAINLRGRLEERGGSMLALSSLDSDNSDQWKQKGMAYLKDKVSQNQVWALVHLAGWKFDSPKEALELYKKAYALGDRFSASQVGDFYSEGKAVAKDRKEAALWYKKAGAHGIKGLANLDHLEKVSDPNAVEQYSNKEIKFQLKGPALFLSTEPSRSEMKLDRSVSLMWTTTGVNGWLTIKFAPNPNADFKSDFKEAEQFYLHGDYFNPKKQSISGAEAFTTGFKDDEHYYRQLKVYANGGVYEIDLAWPRKEKKQGKRIFEMIVSSFKPYP